MKIGIIGVGSIGGTLARQLCTAGHDIHVANSKGPEGVRAFAAEIGATAADARSSIKGADLVIISIPFPKVAQLPKDLFSGLPETSPIIDTGNYYPGLRDPQIPGIDGIKAESVWVAEQIGRPVIKAFNNILAFSLAELAHSERATGRLAVAVAGDDIAAKRIVMGIVDEIGFDPIDAGTLAESWRCQPSTPGYCCDYDADTMRKGLAAAVMGVAPPRRDKVIQYLTSLPKFPEHADLVALNRKFNAVI